MYIWDLTWWDKAIEDGWMDGFNLLLWELNQLICPATFGMTLTQSNSVSTIMNVKDFHGRKWHHWTGRLKAAVLEIYVRGRWWWETEQYDIFTWAERTSWCNFAAKQHLKIGLVINLFILTGRDDLLLKMIKPISNLFGSLVQGCVSGTSHLSHIQFRF